MVPLKTLYKYYWRGGENHTAAVYYWWQQTPKEKKPLVLSIQNVMLLNNYVHIAGAHELYLSVMFLFCVSKFPRAPRQL